MLCYGICQRGTQCSKPPLPGIHLFYLSCFLLVQVVKRLILINAMGTILSLHLRYFFSFFYLSFSLFVPFFSHSLCLYASEYSGATFRDMGNYGTILVKVKNAQLHRSFEVQLFQNPNGTVDCL
jgi:hypothetical protein